VVRTHCIREGNNTFEQSIILRPLSSDRYPQTAVLRSGVIHHALVKLMCDNKPWKHPNGGQCSQFDITFNPDGTGKLNAIGDMGLGWLFEMFMQWEFIATPPRSTAADILKDDCFKHLGHTNILKKSPKFLGSARLRIQMRPIQAKEWSRDLLSETACLPRDFTIVVEEGNFAAVRDDRHKLRMTFDISPYPALETYNEQSESSLRVEDIILLLNEPRSFYAGQLPDELEKARTTGDDAIMCYHTPNCVMS